MLNKRRILIILIILTALLTSTRLAAITVFNVWAQQEMAPKQTFETQEQYNEIAFSNDGKYIAAMSNTADNLAIFNQTHTLWNTNIPDIRAVAISENASLIVAAAKSGLYFFSTENSTPQQHYDLSCENALIALSDDGTILALATAATEQTDSESARLYLFKTGTQSPICNITLQGTLESLSLSANGNYTTISTSQPGALHLFSKQQTTPIWTYKVGEQSGAAKVSDNGNRIVATGGNITDESSLRVYRFSYQSPQPNYIKMISELPPTPRLAVSAQGAIFALGFSQSSRLVLFNLDLPPYGYGPGSVLNTSLPSRPTAIAMSSEGRYTAVGTNTGMYIYEYSGEHISLTKQYTNNAPRITDIEITPNGLHLAAATQNNENTTIYLFDIAETRNSSTDFWLRVTITGTVILAVSTMSIYILHRKRRNQQP